MSGTTATHSDNERLTRNDILRKFKKKTPMQEIMIRFLRNRMAVVGIIIFAAILLLAIFADVIADYETVALKMNIPERLQAPSAAHWLGTDDSGRDVFARIIHGARTSLWIGFVATAFSLLLGGALGAIAGYVGGWLDELIMRIMDVMLCLPEMLLAIAIVAAMGANVVNMIIAIGIARHILLNCMGPIIVQITLIFASSILAISSLSFLGLGIKPPAPEWGNMLSAGRDNMRDYPHLVLAPGMAIFLSIFSLNLLGDGLRDALDPRLKQ